MICNVCQKNEATVHLTQMLEGEIKKMDMCESCAQQQGVDEPGMPLVDLLVGLGPSSSEGDSQSKSSVKVLSCEVCGHSLADFKKTGRLGCSHCYQVFEDQMDPMLRSMHKGIKHTGKTPKNFKKTWFLPNGKVKAKLNPGPAGKGKDKAKVSRDAMQLYRQFNGTDPKSVDVVQVWLPDENSPLVALGEGECPFIGYESGKANKRGEIDTYIHHFGEEGGKKPKLYVTMPPEGMERMLIILGGDWNIEERGDGNLWLVD